MLTFLSWTSIYNLDYVKVYIDIRVRGSNHLLNVFYMPKTTLCFHISKNTPYFAAYNVCPHFCVHYTQDYCIP